MTTRTPLLRSEHPTHEGLYFGRTARTLQTSGGWGPLSLVGLPVVWCEAYATRCREAGFYVEQVQAHITRDDETGNACLSYRVVDTLAPLT